MSSKSLCAIGKLDIDLNLTLRKSEVELFKFDISKYNSVEDLKYLFYPEEKNETEENNKNEEEEEKPDINYFDYISLSSNDTFTNMLLFINRAFKEKIFVELILLNKMEFSEEKKFVKSMIEQICCKNYFFIIENKIYDIPSKINFKIQILEDDTDKIIESKNFQMFENNEMPDETLRDRDKNLFYKLHYNFSKCNYFLSNFDDIIKIEDESPYDIALFFKLLVSNNSKLKIISNFSKNCANESSDSELINSMKKIIDLSDYIISDRETFNNFYEIYFSIFKNQKEINKIKKNKTPNLDYITLDTEKRRKNLERTTILIEKLQLIKIYKQEGINMFISYEEDFNCNEIFKVNKEKNIEIINKNYNYFLSIFIGSFLSRLLHEKTFKTCVEAGILSLKNMIEISKRKIDYITDLDFYNVVVTTKKKRKYQIEKKKILSQFKNIKKKEEGFNLDCTNLNKNKFEEYNALLDENCQSFLTSPFIKNHLLRQGFISRKGKILKDPDKLIIVPHISQKRFLRTTNLNFRFKPSPLKKQKKNIDIDIDNEYFLDKNNNNVQKQENEYQKLKEGLSGSRNRKYKLPPMITNNSFYKKNNNFWKEYKFGKNIFFPSFHSSKKSDYLKKKDFLKILEQFENKNDNVFKTYQK